MIEGGGEANSRTYGSCELAILFWYTDISTLFRNIAESGYHHLQFENCLRNVITRIILVSSLYSIQDLKKKMYVPLEYLWWCVVFKQFSKSSVNCLMSWFTFKLHQEF